MSSITKSRETRSNAHPALCWPPQSEAARGKARRRETRTPALPPLGLLVLLCWRTRDNVL